MASGLKYILLFVLSFVMNPEALCFDGTKSSGEVIITNAEDNSLSVEKDYVEKMPVFPFNDMLLVKDDTSLSKSRLHSHNLFDYDSHKHILCDSRFQLKNPTTDDSIHSPDYYIYTLEKIII